MAVRLIENKGNGCVTHIVDLPLLKSTTLFSTMKCLFRVFVFVKNIIKVPLAVGDISDRNLVRKILKGENSTNKGKPIKSIIHLAAFAYVGESINEPLNYYKNNVVKSLIFLEEVINEMKKNNKLIPIVFSSSCATYGNPEQSLLLKKHCRNLLILMDGLN